MKKQLDPQPLLFPMPALLVGTYGENRTPDAMTAAWAGVCCSKPVCMGVAIRDTRLTYANLPPPRQAGVQFGYRFGN